MLKKTVFTALFLSIAAAGVWSLVTTRGHPIQSTQTRENLNQAMPAKDYPIASATQPSKPSTIAKSEPFIGQESDWRNDILANIRTQLQQRRWKDAIAQIDAVYSKASAEDLATFKALVLSHAETLIDGSNEAAASAILEIYATTFNDVDAWDELAALSQQTRQWDSAVTALLRLSLLQAAPEKFEATLDALIKASSHVRARMESNSDELGILALYQRLYDQHPDYPRFQLELAQSHLRLGDAASARPYLETLQYDPELGALAKQKLAAIDAKMPDVAAVAEKKPVVKSRPRGEIVVPLLRSGNSYLVDVSINSSDMRMLLDTGASITSLSSEAIQRLGLTATGRTLRLSTANGITDAQLYHAEELRLGRLRLKNLTVAEVDFGANSRLQGLLGTDVLNQMRDRFSYVIDNQHNALIFRTR